LQTIIKEGTLPNAFSETSIILILKSDKRFTIEEYYTNICYDCGCEKTILKNPEVYEKNYTQ
jgi:hypothetical protein